MGRYARSCYNNRTALEGETMRAIIFNSVICQWVMNLTSPKPVIDLPKVLIKCDCNYSGRFGLVVWLFYVLIYLSMYLFEWSNMFRQTRFSG